MAIISTTAVLSLEELSGTWRSLAEEKLPKLLDSLSGLKGLKDSKGDGTNESTSGILLFLGNYSVPLRKGHIKDFVPILGSARNVMLLVLSPFRSKLGCHIKLWQHALRGCCYRF